MTTGQGGKEKKEASPPCQCLPLVNVRWRHQQHYCRIISILDRLCDRILWHWIEDEMKRILDRPSIDQSWNKHKWIFVYFLGGRKKKKKEKAQSGSYDMVASVWQRPRANCGSYLQSKLTRPVQSEQSFFPFFLFSYFIYIFFVFWFLGFATEIKGETKGSFIRHLILLFFFPPSSFYTRLSYSVPGRNRPGHKWSGFSSPGHFPTTRS